MRGGGFDTKKIQKNGQKSGENSKRGHWPKLIQEARPAMEALGQKCPQTANFFSKGHPDTPTPLPELQRITGTSSGGIDGWKAAAHLDAVQSRGKALLAGLIHQAAVLGRFAGVG